MKQDTDIYIEKRLYKRLPADLQVLVKSIDSGGVEEGQTRNISGGGILFTSEIHYDVGTTLMLQVLTPTHSMFRNVFPPLMAQAQVVKTYNDTPPYEIAARFLEILQ